MIRTVLVVPTETYRADAFIEAASALGIEVLVATDQSPPLATEMEGRLAVVDFDQPEASAQRIAALAGLSPIHAVVGVDDQGVLTAAHAGELLGLAHNPPDAVAATRNKIDMRSVLASWDVPQPRFAVADQGADVARLAEEVGLPCVIKPVSLSAGTGVIRADTAQEALCVAERVRGILSNHDRSAGEPLLVEHFVAGAEVSLEGLLRNGSLEVLAVFDKPDPLDGPYFEETIFTTPSRLPDAQQAAVTATAAAACSALGLREGPIHAELRIAGRDEAPQVWVMEVAARSIGGLCSRVLRFGAGISLEELILRHATGLDAGDIARSGGAAGVMMLPIPRSGILRGVSGTEAAARVAGIQGVEITATTGRRIEALPEGGRYLGFLFAHGDTPTQVETALRSAHAELDITIVDESEEPEVTTAPDPAPTTTSVRIAGPGSGSPGSVVSQP